MPKKRKVPLRCVNCGVNMFRWVAYAHLSQRARSIIQQWIPSHDHSESVLCCECATILRTLDEGDAGPPAAPARLLGHSLVCRMCGRSLLKKQRSYSLEARHENPGVTRVLDAIAAYSPKLFKHLKMVCRTCYYRGWRASNNAAAADANIPDSDDDTMEGAENSEKTKPQSKQRNEMQTEKHTGEETAKTSHLNLSKYRRVRGTRISCTVCGCREEGAPRAPLSVRRHFLKSRRLYLPGAARLCRKHCDLDADFTPLFQRKLSHDFTDEQVADMLFLMKPFPPALDADNVEAMNQYLRRIWLGVTWEEFRAKMRENPSISTRALAIRLCADTTGECPEVLASLFQLPTENIDEALRITELPNKRNDPVTPPSEGNRDKTEANATTEVESNNTSVKDVFEKEAPIPQALDVDTFLDEIVSE